MNARDSQDALRVIGIFALFVVVATILVYISSKHLSAEQKIAATIAAVVCFAAGQLVQGAIISGDAAV